MFRAELIEAQLGPVRNPFAFKKPTYPQSIRADVSMKWVRSAFAVTLYVVLTGYHAQLEKIKVRVWTLQGVKSPRDTAKPVCERLLPLCKLQLLTDTMLPICGEHSKHMGVKHNRTVVEPHKTEDKSN